MLQNYKLFLVIKDKLVCAFDIEIKTWDINTGQLKNILKGHTINDIKKLSENLIVSASLDRSLRIWNINTGKGEAILNGHLGDIGCIKILPDGQIASGCEDTTIIIWKNNSFYVVINLQSQL